MDTFPTDDPVLRTEQAYAEFAARYARENATASASLVAAMDVALDGLGDAPLVVDVGCGTGRDAEAFRARGCRVIGVDRSEAMLAHAAAAGITTVAADMRHIPLEDGVADCVWSCAALHHLPRAEMAGAVQEVARLIRPGGHCYVSLKEGVGEGMEVSRPGAPPRFFARLSAPALERLLRAAGLVLRGPITRSESPHGDVFIEAQALRPHPAAPRAGRR